MFTRSKLFTLFTRPPQVGGGKDTTMPEAQGPSAPSPAPTPAPTHGPAPDARDDLARQLSTLTDAMRQLAESHKTLLDAVKVRPAPAPAPAPANQAPPPDIGGDPAGGGQRPAAVVDYSRLSPVQQIALGLKDSARGPTNRVSAPAD